MKNLIMGEKWDEPIADFVSDRIPNLPKGERIKRPYVSLGIEKDGEILAGCVYRNYYKHDIEMLFAAKDPSWASKEALRMFFAYPFLQLGVVRVTAIAAKANKKARKFIERSGFKLEGRIRRGMDGVDDAFVYGMLYRECKWLSGVKNGKENRAVHT